MKKAGVESINIDANNGEIVVKYKNQTSGKLADSDLSPELKQEVEKEIRSTSSPITFSQLEQQNNPSNSRNKNNGNAGIIGAILVVGIILAVVIGVAIHKNKKKGY